MKSVITGIKSWAIDRVVRSRAQLHNLPLGRYSVTVARSVGEYDSALRLLRAAYIAQGYEDVQAGVRRVTPFHLLAESTVFVAHEGDRMVGTLTATLDSERGLPMDSCYPEAMNALRMGGATAVELGSLAVVGRSKGKGVTAFMNMAAYRLAYMKQDATHFVVQCHPKAEMIYRAIFGFKRLGPPRIHPELGQPVIGLTLDLRAAQGFMRRNFKKALGDGRTLLDHFVGPKGSPGVQEIPDLDHEAFAAWKMSPKVFYGLLLPEVPDVEPAWVDHLHATWPHRGRLRLVHGGKAVG